METTAVKAANRRMRVQFGLITNEQAITAGMTRTNIETKLRSGDWRLERRGVYRSMAVPPSYEARCLSLVVGRNAVISHRSAAALANLEPFAQPRPEVTLPFSPRNRDRYVHTTTQWMHRDQVMRRGIPCTGVERTILDCAATEPLHVIEEMAESAIRQNLMTWKSLSDYVGCHAGRGRNGSANARALLDLRAGSPTITRSLFSLRVSRLLVEAGLPKPVVEFPVSRSDGRHILALDLAWPDLLKAWELDGLKWHGGRLDMFRDKSKRNSVKSQGWAIQEILWDMYLGQPGQLIQWATDFLSNSQLTGEMCFVDQA